MLWEEIRGFTHGIGDTQISTSDRVLAGAISQAINNEKNNIENNGTDADKEKEKEELINEFEEKKDNMTDEEIKDFNERLKAYIAKWGTSVGSDKRLYYMSTIIDEEMKRIDSNAETAYDIYDEDKGDGWVDSETEQEEAKDYYSTGVLGNPNANAIHTPDEIITEAENFLNAGNGSTTIDGQHLEEASSTLYNILLSIGIFLAVAIGMYLGVKFMLSNAEDKAKVKEALIPYVVGCIIIFTAFVIWRIAILLLRGIA